MQFYVGVTDNNWYRFLSDLRPDELNFWQPAGNQAFKAIVPGSPFLFKLHSPLNFIAGGGFFVQHTFLPVSVAWEVFREKNGAASFSTFAAQIRGYRRRKGDTNADPTIGCIVLAAPFFFERDAWIPVPADWSSNIVQGKRYDTAEPNGERLWAAVRERLEPRELLAQQPEQLSLVAEAAPRYGSEFLTRARLGQSTFRLMVMGAYSHRCAFTGERTLPALQASHIKPYAESGPHDVSNGLLLRSDLHMLFDHGLITITPEHSIEVSPRIHQNYNNGKIYYALQGQPMMVLPERELERPSREFIEWHNRNIYSP